MTNWHEYSTEARAALACLAQGSCYFPGCRTPILVFVDGRPEINVEVARIRGAAAADTFDDVLLLCVPHRRSIDRDRTDHPADLLETWKDQREAGGRKALRDLPVDQLEDLIAGASAAVREQIGAALARFAETDPESADLLRLLIDGLDGRRHRTGADRQTADLLREVTRLVEQLRGPAAEPARERLNVGWTGRPAGSR
jgi:hypothetical protein